MCKSFLRIYRWQRLVHLNRIQPPRAQALLSLLLLILFHGLLDAYLCSAPDTLFKRLQLIVESVLVLLICCLRGYVFCELLVLITINISNYFTILINNIGIK